jgi:tetratricopeptide (TPR) repeat protein
MALIEHGPGNLETASITLILCLALSWGTLCAQDSLKAEDVPLSVQLEGLGPASRIAYLRYLVGEGRADGEAYFQLGVAFHESGSPDSAAYYYKRAIRSSPGLSKVHVNLGVLYDGMGNASLALNEFLIALSIDPNDILALSHAAFTQFLLKRHDKADEYISKALELAPDAAQPHFYLAIFFWENGIYREALREWEKVIELEPESGLADRARENIVLMQNAIKGSGDGPAGWE